MSPGVAVLAAEGSLLDATKRMNAAGLPVLPVVDAGGRSIGVLTAWDVVRSIAIGHDLGSTPASEVVAEDIAVSPDENVDEVARRPGPMVPVVEDGVYIGALTRADMSAAKHLTELLGPAAGSVEQAVSPGDTMHVGNRGAYLMGGIGAVEVIRKGLEAAGKERLDVIVDLPCGHGRVMRVLQAAFPDAKLIACDVDREGVDFCARTFGAEPVYSSADPTQVALDPAADLVWVGSLLTHLPPAVWPGFLDLFRRALGPEGVLVATTLDRPRLLWLRRMGVADPAEMLREHDDAGHAFRSDSGRAYGVMLAAPEWVRERLAESGFDVVSHLPKGWGAPGQDVWVCRP